MPLTTLLSLRTPSIISVLVEDPIRPFESPLSSPPIDLKANSNKRVGQGTGRGIHPEAHCSVLCAENYLATHPYERSSQPTRCYLMVSEAVSIREHTLILRHWHGQHKTGRTCMYQDMALTDLWTADRILMLS